MRHYRFIMYDGTIVFKHTMRSAYQFLTIETYNIKNMSIGY